MPRLLSWGFLALLGAYPLLVYFALGRLSSLVLAGGLLVLALLRLVLLRRLPGDPLLLLAGTLTLVLVAAYGLLSRDDNALRFYPVLMNLAMLLLFAWSLAQPQSIIERMARLLEPELPAAAVTYTRRVTMVWCGFFVVNGALALYTALFLSWSAWALYNGLLAYLLMGTLFAVEYLIRQRVRRNLS